ncbi:unnamed protein product, partial [Heterotrigona itama]
QTPTYRDERTNCLVTESRSCPIDDLCEGLTRRILGDVGRAVMRQAGRREMKLRIREARWWCSTYSVDTVVVGGLEANVRVSLWSNLRPQRRTFQFREDVHQRVPNNYRLRSSEKPRAYDEWRNLRDSRRQWKDHPLMYLHGVERDVHGVKDLSPWTLSRCTRAPKYTVERADCHQENLTLMPDTKEMRMEVIMLRNRGRRFDGLPLLKLSASEKNVTSKLRYIRGTHELHLAILTFYVERVSNAFSRTTRAYALSLNPAMTSMKIFDFVSCTTREAN